MKELFENLADAKEEMRSILDKAETEKRELNADEKAAFDGLNEKKEMIIRKIQSEKDSLERVKKAEKLTVVGSGGYPPFNFIGEDGSVVGFDVDTGSEIANVSVSTSIT